MNAMRLQLKINTKINLKGLLYRIVFYICIVSYIFNGYEFGAPLNTVIVPVALIVVVATITGFGENLSRRDSLCVLLLAIAAMVSAIFSNVVSLSNSRTISFMFCCCGAVIISSVKIQMDDLQKLVKFYRLFSLYLVVWTLLGVVLRFGLDVQGRAAFYMGGILKDQNYVSAYFMPAYAICLYGLVSTKERFILNVIQCVGTILAVFLMGSRGSLLTILIISFLVVVRIVLKDKNIARKIFVLLLMTVAVVVFYVSLQSLPLFERMFDFQSYKSDVRIRLWTAGLNGFLNNRLLGSGIGAASLYSNVIVGNAVHNSFVEVLADQGLIGTILLLWLLIDMCLKPKDNRFFLVLVSIAFFFPMFFLTGYTNMTFWWPIAIVRLISIQLEKHSCSELY